MLSKESAPWWLSPALTLIVTAFGAISAYSAASAKSSERSAQLSMRVKLLEEYRLNDRVLINEQRIASNERFFKSKLVSIEKSLEAVLDKPVSYTHLTLPTICSV